MVGKKNILHLFLAMLFFSFLIGCSSGSSAKGSVEDKVTGQPINGASIDAETKTNIEEDKKFERIGALSDDSGNFKLKGLSPRYSYKIKVYKEGYSTLSAFLSPPEKGQTKLLKPFYLIEIKPINGYVVDKFTKEPIVDVKVHAKSKRTIKEGHEYEKRNAVTNEEGEFALDGLYPNSKYTLKFQKKGYTSATIDFISRGDVENIKRKINLIKIQSVNAPYIISNGKFAGEIGKFNGKWIKQITGIKERMTKKHYSVWPNKNIFYFKSGFKYPAFKKANSMSLAFAGPQNKLKKIKITPIEYFKEMEVTICYDSFSGKPTKNPSLHQSSYCKSWIHKDKNIYVYGVLKEGNRIASQVSYGPTNGKFKAIPYSDPHYGYRGREPLRGKIHVSTYPVSDSPNMGFCIIDIKPLKSGFYALSGYDENVYMFKLI